MFEELEQRSDAYSCQWQENLLGESSIPARLVTALAERRADAATSVEALQAHRRSGRSEHQSDPYWSAIIDQGHRQAVSRTYPWRDRPAG